MVCLITFQAREDLNMPKQLSFSFENEWIMRVIDTISEDKKEEAIFSLKEIFVAYFDMKSTKGANNGE
jgi:hypothetical protein